MDNTIKLKNKFNNPFVSLKHKNFRYYWIGMSVSLIGTWMQNIAQPWLAYSLTKSPFLLSLIGTLQFTPILIFSLFAGVIVDRFPKKKLLICTQSASLIISLILSILIWIDKIQYWHILILAMCLGVVNSVDMSSRQSFIIELVEKEDLMNAIALNSMAFNTARIIGPSIAGVIMGYFGVGICFLINSISYAAVLISLFNIKPRVLVNPKKKIENVKVVSEIKDGLKYIVRNDVLLNTLLIIAIVGTFAPNINILAPVFAKEILHQNERCFANIMSMMGIGSFLGAMAIATLSRSGPKRRLLYFTPIIVGACLLLVGFTNHFIWTGIFIAINGFFFIIFSSSANSTLQIHSLNEYRGRVMSVYTLVFAGSTPIGNLYAGLFADKFNARIGFIACGGIILVLIVPLYIYFARKSKLYQ